VLFCRPDILRKQYWYDRGYRSLPRLFAQLISSEPNPMGCDEFVRRYFWKNFTSRSTILLQFYSLCDIHLGLHRFLSMRRRVLLDKLRIYTFRIYANVRRKEPSRQILSFRIPFFIAFYRMNQSVYIIHSLVLRYVLSRKSYFILLALRFKVLSSKIDAKSTI